MYLFFDTETTGLPKSWNAPVTNLNNWPRLVQLACLWQDQNGNILAKGDWIIKPEGFSIPANSTAVHRISNEKALQAGHPLLEVLQEFAHQVSQANCLVAHNLNFDEKVLGAEFLRHNLPNCLLSKDKICTMQKATNFCQIPGAYGYKWPKLSELHYKLFGSDFAEAHNAAVDIQATARCFWELKKRGLV